MNCPQCQAANAPDAVFCGSCGAQVPAAESATPLGYTAPSTPGGYGAPSSPGGYAPPSGGGYPPPSGGYGAPSGGYAPSSGGYGPPSGYSAPGGYGQAGQVPPAAPPQNAGYSGGQYQQPQGQYQQGQYQQDGQFQPQGQYQPPVGGAGYAPRVPSNVPPVSFDLNRLTSVDKIVAGGSLVALISVFLPWYTISSGAFGNYSWGATSLGHGWFWLEFVVALALIAYLAMRAAWAEPPVKLPVAHAPLLLVGTGVQLLLVLINFIFIPYASSGDGWDWGAFVGLLAALAAAGPVLVPAVRSYRASRNAAGGGRPF
jgi:hypothetical protein